MIVESAEVLVHLQRHEIRNSACMLLTRERHLQLCCVLFYTPLIKHMTKQTEGRKVLS